MGTPPKGSFVRRQRMWRVENARHEGPYNCNTLDGERFCFAFSVDYESHPPPSADPKLLDVWNNLVAKGVSGDYIFGFNSLKSFRKWFHSEEQIAWLKKHDFYLALYKLVGPPICGKTQMAVRSDDALFVKLLTEEEGGF